MSWLNVIFAITIIYIVALVVRDLYITHALYSIREDIKKIKEKLECE